MAKDDHDVEMIEETMEMDTAGPSVTAITDPMTADSVATDLDSQPLNDLGVSVMDQDVLERNVAAQVGTPPESLTDNRRTRQFPKERTNWTNGGWRRRRQRKSTPSSNESDIFRAIERQIRQQRDKVQSTRTLVSARHAIHTKIVSLVPHLLSLPDL